MTYFAFFKPPQLIIVCIGLNGLALWWPSFSFFIHCFTIGAMAVLWFGCNHSFFPAHTGEDGSLDFPEDGDLSESKNGFQLTESERIRYRHRLETYLSTEKPFLNPGLRIQDVSEATGIPRHHLSMVINQGFGMNFNQWINGHRIEYLKQGLHNPEWAYLTWEGMALESGFGSRATFLRVFKKETGMLPTVYAEQLEEPA